MSCWMQMLTILRSNDPRRAPWVARSGTGYDGYGGEYPSTTDRRFLQGDGSGPCGEDLFFGDFYTHMYCIEYNELQLNYCRPGDTPEAGDGARWWDFPLEGNHYP